MFIDDISFSPIFLRVNKKRRADGGGGRERAAEARDAAECFSLSRLYAYGQNIAPFSLLTSPLLTLDSSPPGRHTAV
jgi:hypothetical protein